MAGVQVKGSLTVAFDALELEARLVFSPDTNEGEWTAEKITKLLAEKRLSPLPSSRNLEELLKSFSRAKETLSVIVCRGQAPIDPTPERVSWADLPVPDELRDIMKARLENADAPRLFKTRIEKIRKETVVKKPGALPFLPAKEEVQVSYDKKEIREQVFSDFVVEDTAYAERGVRVGLISPSRPGKPGKNVFGRSVPPRTDLELEFLPGEGLRREKNEIIAEKSGFIRIAQGWADLIPYSRSAWEVKKSADGASLLLDYDPGAAGSAVPQIPDILSMAYSLGAQENSLIDTDVLESAVQQAASSGKALDSFLITRRADAEVRVDISSDKLKATLNLRKALSGAEPLKLKDISEAIRNSGIKGFDSERVKADILAFYNGPDLELKDYILVEGTAPSRGEDKTVTFSIDFMEDEEKENLIERIDTYKNRMIGSSIDSEFPLSELSALAQVAKGVRIAQVSNPAKGADGVDVFGSIIKGLPGNDPDIKLYGALSLRGSDLVSEEAGLLLLAEKGSLFYFQLMEYQDSRISVMLSEDAMQASMELVREKGLGLPLRAEMVSEALKEASVVRGIDAKAVAGALSTALEKGSCPPTLVARGEAPVASGAFAYKWLVTLPSDTPHAEVAQYAQENKKKKLSVSEGTALLEIIKQGSEGRAGFDVTGRVIDPEKAAPVEIHHDDSIREVLSPRGVILTAAQSGELSFDGWNLSIRSVHTVSGDISQVSGNLNFIGEVRIQGAVKPGCAVLAGGDIYIGDTVEASLVSSGAAVKIGKGIIGGGKGVVRARNSIQASFVEHATLLSVGDIVIQNGCLNCNVKTNGALRLLGERGNLIAGVCKARNGVDVANIGSERGIRTELSFGQDYLVKDQIELTERDIEKIKADLVELDKKLKQLENAHASLTEVRAEKVRLMKLMEKSGVRLFTLNEKYEEHHASEIKVRGTVFPGVVMESHGRYYEVKQKRSRVVFFFNKEVGRIQEKPLV